MGGTFESSDLFRGVHSAPQNFSDCVDGNKTRFHHPSPPPPPPPPCFHCCIPHIPSHQNCGISGAWAFVEAAGGPAWISPSPIHPPSMGPLPIMGVFGDYNEAKRATTAAAVTCFPLSAVELKDASFILLGTFSLISFHEKQETRSFL